MKKRKPFFIRNNFQLKFIIGFISLLVIATLISTFFIERLLQNIVEEAAFSAHLSVGSSGELFWRTIVKVNVIAAGVSVIGGLFMILGMYFYLEFFFRSLASGLNRWANGDFSFRFRTKNKWFGRKLLNDFNETAQPLDDRASKIRLLTESLKTLLNTNQQGAFRDIKAAHDKLRKINCP